MTQAQAIALIDNDSIRRLLPHAPHWADLGCGSGVFTLALAALLPPDSFIDAIDRQPTVPRQTTPNHVTILPVKSDFVKKEFAVRELDGILMANSLHYVKDKPALLRKLRSSLLPEHSFLIVEYDTDRPTPIWVPYPVSFTALAALFRAEGYTQIKKLNERPSAYGRSMIYAALIRL